MWDYLKQTGAILKNKPLIYKNIKDFRNNLDEAVVYLSENDEILRKIIPGIGVCRLKPHKKYFETLVDAIISQQLSVTVAEAIFKRFKLLFRNDTNGSQRFPAPADIISAADEKLRACGLSKAKVRYVKDLALHVLDNKVRIMNLNNLPDNEIIEELIQVKGIGVWTAQMFLIFCLGRLNVLPVDDLGLKKAIMLNYKLRKLPDASRIGNISKLYNWEPYNSVATWYLWQSLSVNNYLTKQGT